MANIDEIAKALGTATGNRAELEEEFFAQAERLLRPEARRIAAISNSYIDADDLVQIGLARALRLLRGGLLGTGHTAHAVVRNGARDMRRAAARAQGMSEDESRIARAAKEIDPSGRLDNEELAAAVGKQLGRVATSDMVAATRTALAAHRAARLDRLDRDELDDDATTVAQVGTEDRCFAGVDIEAPADVVVRLVPRLIAAAGGGRMARRSARAVVGALALDPTVEGLHGAVRSLRALATVAGPDEVTAAVTSVGAIGEDEMSGAPAGRLLRALLALSSRPQVAAEALRAVGEVLATTPGCAGLQAAARLLAAAMATIPPVKVRDAKAAIRRYVETVAAQSAEVEAYEALRVVPLRVVPVAEVAEIEEVEVQIATVAVSRRRGLVDGWFSVQDRLDLWGEAEDQDEDQDDLPATVQERLDLFGEGEVIAISRRRSRRARAA